MKLLDIRCQMFEPWHTIQTEAQKTQLSGRFGETGFENTIFTENNDEKLTVVSYHYLATEGLAIYSKVISDILKIRKKK